MVLRGVVSVLSWLDISAYSNYYCRQLNLSVGYLDVGFSLDIKIEIKSVVERLVLFCTLCVGSVKPWL